MIPDLQDAKRQNPSTTSHTKLQYNLYLRAPQIILYNKMYILYHNAKFLIQIYIILLHIFPDITLTHFSATFNTT
jgi:hypothetical protein